MRSGGWERSARDARSVPVVDTGASIAGPGGERAAGPRLAAGRRPLRADRGASASPRSTRPTRDIAARIERVAPTSRTRRRGGRRGGAARAGRRRPRGEALPRQRLLDLPPALLGDADPDRSTARPAAPVPVPEADLPVVLPRDIEPTGEGNPLAERPDFVDVACPSCGGAAKRETDTLDCHFDALWLWVPAAVPPEDRAEQMFDPPRPEASGCRPSASSPAATAAASSSTSGSSPRRCATSAPSPSSRTASRSPAASSTRW